MVIETLTALSALLLVLALIYGMLWLSRRFNLVPGQPALGSKAKSIEITDVTPVGQQHRLMAVRWRGRDLLLSVGPSGVNRLDRITPYRRGRFQDALATETATDDDDHKAN